MKRILYFTLTISLALTSYVIGRHQSRHVLIRCQAANTMLSDDLARAVRRGVVLEANLTICEDSKNAITH